MKMGLGTGKHISELNSAIMFLRRTHALGICASYGIGKLGACVRSDQIHQKRIQADKRRKRQLAMGFLEAQSCKRTDAAYVRLSSVQLFYTCLLVTHKLKIRLPHMGDSSRFF